MVEDTEVTSNRIFQTLEDWNLILKSLNLPSCDK